MPSLRSHLCADRQEKLLDEEEGLVDSPESLFDLPLEDSKQDWFHQNAAMQCKTSVKLKGSGRSAYSARTAMKPKSSSTLIALPRSRNSSVADGNLRQSRVTNVRLFRTRSEPGGKGVVCVSEPGSPKVSCTGKVRSKEEGGRRTGVWKRIGIVLRNRFGSNRVVSKGSTSTESQLRNKIHRQSSV